MEQSLIDYIIEVFDGVLLDEYGWEHYSIKGKKYDIRFDPSRIEWSCDCPASNFFRGPCKHIKAKKEELIISK